MLIFLDIDGVMVPAQSWRSPEILNDGFPAFSNRATETLRKLISGGDTVWLTTSHKALFTIEEWKDIFTNRGIKIDDLKTLPENVKNLSRKDEILQWFKSNEVNEDFVLIDDDKCLNDLPNHMKQHLIQPASSIGLTEEHLEVVKDILLLHR